MGSYEEIQTQRGDWLYLDPPYANTKGLYFGGIDVNKLWDWLRRQESGYALSYDGISGDKDSTEEISRELYDKHIYISNGKSGIKRVLCNGTDAKVYESLYIKEVIK